MSAANANRKVQAVPMEEEIGKWKVNMDTVGVAAPFS
jgi:hypothetical protein